MTDRLDSSTGPTSMVLSDHAPSRPARVAVAAAIASLAVAFLCGFTVQRRLPGIASHSDFAVQWFCTKVLWTGGNPYAAAGPGRSFDWPAPLVYPATALVAIAPLAGLPLHVAEAAFLAFGTAALAYLLTARGWWRLCVFLSAPFSVAITTVQWSPLLAAAAVAPPLAWLVAAKPSVGLAIAAYCPHRRWLRWAIGGGAALAVAAFALEPSWVGSWLGALAQRPAADTGVSSGTAGFYSAPVALPGGAVVLLAVLRWRRPEARLLAAMASVPHIMTGYELVPLIALVPATFAEALLLAVGSWVARYGFAFGQPYADLNASYRAAGVWGLWCVLVPMTLMVLSRPNEGEVPASMDRAASFVRRAIRRCWYRL
ncbi:hypothetical protein [Roseisolibacter sp. H3M3-2]|uniref:hypothetical protein n=1 Tax=Roseisolibacter sp. H3M3-2 TaxID=3031323 RepID=UPI0023DC4D71|nr:hypothetical protein [Roseisolibacter sp. H3M3-2]MDF1501885.1 hypothetical protein [Roseisolibacter sp. H3M3-2]